MILPSFLMNLPFISPEEEEENKRKIGPYEDEAELEAAMLDEGPASQAYSQYLLDAPNREDYKPGIGRSVLAAIAGGLGGFAGGPSVGARIGQDINDLDYKRAQSEYETRGRRLAAAAGIESKQMDRQRLFAQSRLTAKQRREEKAEAQARWEQEEARRKASEEAQERNRVRDDERAAQRHKEALAEIAARSGSRGGKEYKPEIEYDTTGFATGRIFDPGTRELVTIPGLKGFRRSSESPTITQKKSNAEVSIQRANDLMSTLDRLTSKGTKGTWHIGPGGQGRMSDLLTNIGIVDDPDVIDLHGIAQELANTELYSLSGAQINNKEYERLRRTLPDVKKSEAKFRQDIKRFIKFHEAALKGLISENDPDWTPERLAPSDKNPLGLEF